MDSYINKNIPSAGRNTRIILIRLNYFEKMSEKDFKLLDLVDRFVIKKRQKKSHVGDSFKQMYLNGGAFKWKAFLP